METYNYFINRLKAHNNQLTIVKLTKEPINLTWRQLKNRSVKFEEFELTINEFVEYLNNEYDQNGPRSYTIFVNESQTKMTYPETLKIRELSIEHTITTLSGKFMIRAEF